MPKKHILLCCFLALIVILTLGACSSPAVSPQQTPTRLPPPTPTTQTAEPAPSTPPQTLTPTRTLTPLPPVTTTAPTSSPAPAVTAVEGPITINQIKMVDSQNGWAIGKGLGPVEQVLKTTDGGITWQVRTPPEPPPASADLSKIANGAFTTTENAWVIYQNDPVFAIPDPTIVWRTEDGGATWQASNPLPLPGPPEFMDISDFQLTSSGTGYFLTHVGAGMNHDYLAVFQSDPTGGSWDRVAGPTETFNIQGCQKTGLAFLDASYGWMTVDCQGVRDTPYYFSSADGGSNWENIEVPPPDGEPDLYARSICGVYSPYLFDIETGFFVMRCLSREDYQTSEDYLYKTIDGGLTWEASAFPGGDLLLLNQDDGFALSRDIYKSVDQGTSWNFVKSVNWDGQFSFVDALNGWAVARSGDAIALVITGDGGLTWQEITPILD